MIFKFKGTEYELADTLRVAYELQKDFNHKPYTEIFAGLNKAMLEDQVKIVYCAFRMKNPKVATFTEFLDYILDELGIQLFMETFQELIERVTFNGLTEEEIKARKEDNEKNVEKLP